MANKPKKRKGKIRIKQSARLRKSNSGLVGVSDAVKPIASNVGVLRVRLKHKA